MIVASGGTTSRLLHTAAKAVGGKLYGAGPGGRVRELSAIPVNAVFTARSFLVGGSRGVLT